MHLLIIYFIICFIFYYNITKGLVSMVRVIVRVTTKIVSYIDKQSHRLTDSQFLKTCFLFLYLCSSNFWNTMSQNIHLTLSGYLETKVEKAEEDRYCLGCGMDEDA